MVKHYQKVMNDKYRNNRFIAKIVKIREQNGDDLLGKFKFEGILTRVRMTQDGIEVYKGDDSLMGFHSYEECAESISPSFVRLALYAAKRHLLKNHPEFTEMYSRNEVMHLVKVPMGALKEMLAFCEENGKGDAEFCKAIRERIEK